VFLFVGIVLLLISVGLLVPISVLFVECGAALLPSQSEKVVEDCSPKIAILIPAHNEAVCIGATIETLLPLTEQERLVVIADNCNDETVSIARSFGVTVVERQNTELLGKGYALDYGLRFLEAEPPDVVVFVDADCMVESGTIETIARQAMAVAKPVQATYLMEQPVNPKPKDAVSALAFMVKNLVRPSGLQRLGLPCLLTGTGMAFPWSVIQSVTLASDNIVEDMQLALDLSIAGSAAQFCPNARVIGRLPAQTLAAKTQRTRWEHGHLQTLITQVPRLFKASIEQKRLDLLALALDMSVPPLSFLVMIWVAVTGMAVFATTLGVSQVPAIILCLEGLLIFSSIVGAWAKFGRADLPALTLLSVPFYLIWKIPLYFSFLLRRQTKWVRTERDAVDISKS
jgi:cellulose synthase/poly-beta-1,6-N-acetylglucosamine synthase-like glycosyltransferase